MAVWLILIGVKKIRHKRLVLDKGEIITGIIKNYIYDESTIINGKPVIKLCVDCYYNGVQKWFIVETGSSSEEKFPIDFYVQIAVLGDDAVLVLNSVKSGVI